jgi:hypothetical protein
MGRKNTSTTETRGTVQPFKDARGRTYWRARITFPDGARLWVGPRFYDEDRARDYAADKSREAEKRGLTVAQMAPSTKGAGEMADDWHDRYLKHCKERGLSTVGDKGDRWSKWISPKIGSKAMAAVTREDVEDVRDFSTT